MKHVTFLSATASSATTLAQGSTSDASSTDSSCSRYDAVSKVSLTVHSDQKVEASDRVQEHIQDRSKVQITGRKRLNSTSKSTSDSSAVSKCTDSDEGSGKRRKLGSECFKDDLQTGGEMISRLNSRESSTTLQFKFDTSGFVSGANESSMPTINSASSQSSMLQLIVPSSDDDMTGDNQIAPSNSYLGIATGYFKDYLQSKLAEMSTTT